MCGEWQPDLAGFEGRSGIHTHGDGLIHIHPFEPSATGAGATLERFLEDTDELSVEPGLLEVDGTVHEDGDTCDGEAASVRIAWWPDTGADEPEVLTDPADVRFLADGEVVTIAFLPDGDDIPEPPGTSGPT